MRDRLVEIFQKRSCYYNKCNGPCSNCGCVTIDDDDIGKLVDDLLANGVVALPCKVGDMVYFILEDNEMEEGKDDCVYNYEIDEFKAIIVEGR